MENDFKEGIAAFVARSQARKIAQPKNLIPQTFFFNLPYLSSIHEKAMYRYVLDGKFALAWELLFPGHLSFT